MEKIKNIYAAIKRLATHPWTMAIIVGVIVSAFALWYGAAWTLVVALPLIYDYYVAHGIRNWHRKMYAKYRWWQVMWALWCAAVFALVVGIIVHMLLFRWEQPFLITFAVILAYAVWEELKGHTKN